MTLPSTKAGNFHVYNQYTVRVSKRDELRAHLKEKGVGTEIYYPLPCICRTAIRILAIGRGPSPLSERAAEEVMSLPIYAELTDAQLTYVVEMIADFFNRR